MSFAQKVDSKGVPFEFGTLVLNRREFAKIISEVNTCYSKYEKKTVCVHYSHGIDENAYRYYFENHGFDEYNFVLKRPIL